VSARLFAQFPLHLSLPLLALFLTHTHSAPGIPIPASGPIEWIQVSIGARQNGEWSHCPCRGHNEDAALVASKATWRLADTMLKMHSPHRNRKKKSSCSCGLVSVSPEILATGGNEKDSVGAHTHPSISRQTSARIVSILVAHHARPRNSLGDKIEELERRNIVSGPRNTPTRRRDDKTRRRLRIEEDIAGDSRCESSKYPDKWTAAKVYSKNPCISGRFAASQFGSLSKRSCEHHCDQCKCWIEN
jgi:hypothetical protein